jgi:peroxiredoxin family protein
MDETLSLVLFSGTDDKLSAAAILAAGACALGRPVNVLLQYWALDAFRPENVDRPMTLVPEARADAEAAVRERAPGGRLDWLATFRQAKELGGLSINACSASLDLLGLDVTKLDPIVDGAAGVATFFLAAGDGQIVFI